MLILSNNLSYDCLKILSIVNNNKILQNINDIYDYILNNNPVITNNKKIIKIENNTIILENTDSFFDLFVGYISDIPIIKIDILHKFNDNDNDDDDNNYEIILSYKPIIKNINICTSTKLEHLLFPENYNDIEIYTKNVYTLQYPYKKNPFFVIHYRLYFDTNINLDHNIDKIDKINSVGVLINNNDLRKFVLIHGINELI